MADIELAIKMPKEVYESIINGKNYISYQEYVEEAIKNGTPLPNEHGIHDFEKKVLARLDLIHSENVTMIRQLGCDNYLDSHAADCYRDKWKDMKTKEQEADTENEDKK